MHQIYSSSQVAGLLHVTEATIRTWKHRNPDLFEEGVHYITEGRANRWTEAGLALLKQLAGQDAPGETPPRVSGAVEGAVEGAIALTQPHALDTALGLVDETLALQVQRILSNPTASEREVIEQHLKTRIEQFQGFGIATVFRDVFAAANQDFAQIRGA